MSVAETISGLYKAECIRTTVFYGGPYKPIADVEYATASWVDWSTTTAFTVCSTSSHPRSSNRSTTLTTPAHRLATPPTRRRHETGTVHNGTDARRFPRRDNLLFILA